jgi:single-stranded DNA-binding protein
MATDNTVTLIGNLTDDPEFRFTANGATVATSAWPSHRYPPGRHWTNGETSVFRINC